MLPLQLRFLGGVSLNQGEEYFNDGLAGKAVALLCYLAVTNKPQTRATLAGLLWSDFPDQRARSNLRDTLAMLRRSSLSPYLIIGRQLISFNSNLPYSLDTAEFEKAVQNGIKVQLNDVPALENALENYKGEFLAGFQISRAGLFEEWVTIQRQRLHLLATRALQRLVSFHLELGNLEVAIVHASRLLSLEPWREETHRNLMRLHLLRGEHDVALKQYESCRRILAEELGVEPSKETKTLFHNIREQMHKQDGDLRSVPGALPHAGLVLHNIPGQVTPFIGREKELRAIDNVLGDKTARLITIFGVGGIGKTRLALAVGEEQLRRLERNGEFRFPDGVFFAPLEAAESPAEIVPNLCQALGFQPIDEGRSGRSIERQLLDHLRLKRLLLIIDNFEQLLPDVGLLTKIRRAAAHVHLIVTSRQRMSLHGERLYALEGMQYPTSGQEVGKADHLLEDYSAPALFVNSARRVKSGFRLEDEEVPALVRLCQMVDGLPLAVELAAGWVNVLSLGDIVAEIEQGLSFMESDFYDLPERHRSMEAVFDVSWQRMTVALQRLFAGLSVFRGGFTRQAASQVVGASLRQLATLLNRALIQYDKNQDRYQVHRLLRQFGEIKLACEPILEQAVREGHCAFFCTALQRWNSQLKGDRQLEALEEFEDESANVRTAWQYAVETRRLAAIDQAAAGLGRLYLWRRRFHEGESAYSLAAESLQQGLMLPEKTESDPGTVRLLARVKLWESLFSDPGKAIELVNQALRLLESPEIADLDTRRERALGLRRAADLAFETQGEDAQLLYTRSLALYRELEDTWEMAEVLTVMGWKCAHQGEMEQARLLAEEALALVQEIGDHKRTADVLWLLGTLAILRGQMDEASHLLGESLDIREYLGDRITDIMSGPLDLGMTLTWIGRMAEADAVREETLALYEAQGHPAQIALAHVRLANSKFHIGEFDVAEYHARIGLEQCRKLDNQRGAGVALFMLASIFVAAGEADRAEPLLEESLSSLRQAEGTPEIGWILGLFAEVARRQGHPTAAKKYVCEALLTASGLLGIITNLAGLLVYVNLLTDEGQEGRAVEIAALLEKQPFAASSVGFQSLYAERLAAVRVALAPDVVAAAESRGRARDLQETAAEILTEFNEAVAV